MYDAALLPYQARVVNDQSEIRLVEKSRRVGISWAVGYEGTLLSARSSGYDTLYVGYNAEMALDFIRDAAFFAKTINEYTSPINESIYNDEKDILAYAIKFSSGHEVKALSSRPTNLRGKHKSLIILDEFAFHADPEGLLKAAIANMMWGGRLIIISTHNGVNSYFNKLICDIKAGHKRYSMHRITLDDALADGLYRRIARVTGKDDSIEAQEKWRSDLISAYGEDADEELRCIPSSRTGRIYNYNEDINLVKELPAYNRAGNKILWKYIWIIDYGSSQAIPTEAISILAYCDELQNVYVVESSKSKSKTTDDIRDKYEADKLVYGGFVKVLGDQGGLGGKFNDEIRLRFKIPIVNCDKKNKLGYRKLFNSELSNRRILILEGQCNDWIKEAQDLEWNDKGTDCKEGAADHCTDSVLYGWRAAMAFLSTEKEAQPKVGSKEALELEAAQYERKITERLRREKQLAERGNQDSWGAW